MAVIGRIRKYSGLLIIIVGVALAGFVLQDFFNKSNSGRDIKEFGEVENEKISYRDFDAKVEEQIEQIKKQSENQQLGNERINQIRMQVWNQMVREIIMNKQYEKLGITVTTDELYDLVQGKDVHPYILQSFTNPNTNQLDRERLSQFLKNFDQLDAEIKQQWVGLEKAIKEDRLTKKYNALVANGFYQPKLFLERGYNNKNNKAKALVVNLAYTSVNDKQVSVSEDDLNKAYEENKKNFELSESLRMVDFIVFDVLPSEEDMRNATEDIAELKEELANTDDRNIANFINSNSDARYDSSFFAKGKLPVKIDSAVFSSAAVTAGKKAGAANVSVAKPGLIVGPYLDNNTYYLAKLIDVQSKPDSMKARHILIAYEGTQAAEQTLKRSKMQAKKLADSLLQVLQKQPALFEELSNKFSADKAANEKGGDLGWFADGAMVYAFNQACLKNKVGEKVLAETMFGYHLIDITGKKEPTQKARVAIVKRTVDPSSKTIQEIYARVSRFTAENQTQQAFEAAVAKQGLNKRSADYVREMDSNLPGVEQAREVVRWAFDEKTKPGTVRDFELEGKYLVAVLKSARQKGIPELADIKSELTAIVIKDKKAEMLANKIKEAQKGTSTISQLAQKLNAKVDTLNDVNFSSSFLPGVGQEPAVVGTLFTMKKGKISEPVKGEKGVFVIYADDFIAPQPINDFRGELMQSINSFRQRAQWEVFNALQKAADITDNRLLYY